MVSYSRLSFLYARTPLNAYLEDLGIKTQVISEGLAEKIHRSLRVVHTPAAVKLSRLPTVKPATKHRPMKPPATSLSPSSTHSPAAIMELEPSQPLDKPKKSNTRQRKKKSLLTTAPRPRMLQS